MRGDGAKIATSTNNRCFLDDDGLFGRVGNVFTRERDRRSAKSTEDFDFSGNFLGESRCFVEAAL